MKMKKKMDDAASQKLGKQRNKRNKGSSSRCKSSKKYVCRSSSPSLARDGDPAASRGAVQSSNSQRSIYYPCETFACY